MIYQIVEIETGRSVEDTRDRSLAKLKRSLHWMNFGALMTEEKLVYAIACYLPDVVAVTTHRHPSLSVPIAIENLSPEQRVIFWDYYVKNSSCEIPASEFSKTEVK